jgi:predicted RNase H-like HicB family nuclease
MNTQDYMKLPYNFVIRRVTDESGKYYYATVLELSGCQSTGESFEDAYAGILEAMEGWIETKLEYALPIPPPIEYSELSRAVGRA